MRYLFALTILFVTSFFLAEISMAAQVPFVSYNSPALTSAKANKLQGPSVKAKGCFAKVLFENIIVLPHVVKKSSSPEHLFAYRAGRSKVGHFISLTTWSVYADYRYNYIIDFLYPKHVFW